MNTLVTRVLLIEDCRTDYELTQRSLARASTGGNVTWARTIADGAAALAAEPFDVVLLDLSLPDSTGLETVCAIRAINPDVPLVVLTGTDDRELELLALEAGAQGYLRKSAATPLALRRAIDDAYQRHQNVVEIRRLLAQVESQAETLRQQKELLQRKNRRLRKLYKTAHRFVDNVSHEFRTPLTVIKDYVTLIREGLVGEVNDEQRRMLDIVGVRADDLNNMVDDMLDVSKLEAGLLGIWRQRCDLAEIVKAVRPALDRKAMVRDIAFRITVAEDLPQIYCDADKVGRVIINLVTNAFKFCGDPGDVRLHAAVDREHSEIVVSVSDNGAGIDPDALSLIFQRFKQLNTRIKQSTKGFGLGLNIAKELVALNFGEIGVESQVSRGSTFSFTVPLAEPLEVMRRYLAQLQRSTHGPSMVSLVVAEVDGGVPPADAEDVDALFNCLLRRGDLLFRPAPWGWLFVVPTPPCELAEFIARAQSEWKRTNRNRPFGPLPEFRMHGVGSWRVAAEGAALLERFQGIFPPEDVPV